MAAAAALRGDDEVEEARQVSLADGEAAADRAPSSSVADVGGGEGRRAVRASRVAAGEAEDPTGLVEALEGGPGRMAACSRARMSAVSNGARKRSGGSLPEDDAARGAGGAGMRRIRRSAHAEGGTSPAQRRRCLRQPTVRSQVRAAATARSPTSAATRAATAHPSNQGPDDRGSIHPGATKASACRRAFWST
jgi:hypothetical protein